MKYRVPLSPLIVLLLAMGGCQPSSDRASAIGEAFVGPATLNIRQEIAPRSATVATVRHGERLEIIQQRRRFLKVRTPKGIEGWTDERLLMGSAQIKDLQQLSADSKDFPSQGKATTYDTLNIHTEPQRFSPSYLQVREGEKVDVIGHRAVPRQEPSRKPILPPVQRPARKKSERAARVTRLPAPPVPPPPGPPANWNELSHEVPDELPAQTKTQSEAVPEDDWTLVRTTSGQSGWVLTRRLFMAIPDEVAQYAEGRRITSYFSLGRVRDADKVKDIWLWTTTEKSLAPWDFDSFRVFIWSFRRHRYETALIQRKLKGYYPVLLEQVNGHSGFSVCVGEDGALFRRSYALIENLVRLAGEKPCVLQELYPGKVSGKPDPALRQASPPVHPPSTLAERLKLLRKQWFP